MDNLSKSFDLATTEVRLELVTYVRISNRFQSCRAITEHGRETLAV
jgi:hypothetical protein